MLKDCLAPLAPMVIPGSQYSTFTFVISIVKVSFSARSANKVVVVVVVEGPARVNKHKSRARFNFYTYAGLSSLFYLRTYSQLKFMYVHAR